MSDPRVKAGYVYLIRAESGLYKIGASVNPWARIAALPGTQGALSLVHTIASDGYYAIERLIHSLFADKRAGGEWFRLDEADVALVRSLSACEVDSLPDWLASVNATTAASAPVPPEYRAGPPTKTFLLRPEDLDALEAIRHHYGLSTESSALRLAIRMARHALDAKEPS